MINTINGRWVETPVQQGTLRFVKRELEIYVDGEQVVLEQSLKVWNHSPTGFNIGYPGSGPAQTALGILLAVLRDPDRAARHHQAFKFEFIARLEQNKNFEFALDVLQWVEDQERSQLVLQKFEQGRPAGDGD